MSELEQWYAAKARSLPWRETRDPYAIWVSEIMLQQTRVDTVLDYYRRFLARCPTIGALAEASLDEVLKLWEGLGYYARGRNLHAAARAIVSEHAGQFPRTPAAVAALPGIGPSTANAICSAAYGDPLPVLDGNVKRVLVRLLNLREDPTTATALRALWRAATEWLARAPDPFLHNQAMMELGALVCLPRAPRCAECPLATECLAHAAGTAPHLPLRKARRTVPHHTIAVGVLHHEEGIFIQRRPAQGLLGGLWEFPGGKREGREPLKQTVRREFLEELGIEVAVGAKIATVKHAYSHFSITLHAYHCLLVTGTPILHAASEGRFVPLDRLADHAFPRANQRILEALHKQA